MSKRSCTNALLLCSSVLITLAVIELLLAHFWPQTIISKQYHEQYDPVMGWANTPNVSGAMSLNPYARTPAFHRSHNSEGLRSTREFSHAKRKEVKRLLMIGDSYFWGYGVDDRQVLSELLQERGGEAVEVINGAVTGYGTDQELLWLINRGLRYQPDVVILGFYPGNDMVEICTSISYGYPKPYYTYDNGGLTVHNIPVPDTRTLRTKWMTETDGPFDRLKSWLRHNLHLYQLVAGRLNAVPAIRTFFVRAGIARKDSSSLTVDLPKYQLTDHDKQMDLSDALLREMKRASERAGAKFMLVFLPNKEIEPGYDVGYSRMVGYGRDAYDISANFPWNTASSDYLNRMTRKEKIHFLDLLPVVRAAHRRGEQFFYPGPEDHHWSAAGHRIAADAIFDRLIELGWLR